MSWADVLVSLIPAVVGVVIGGGITLLVAWSFYCKQSKDLEDGIDRLEGIVTTTARYLERDGVIENVELDDRGRLKFYTQTIKVAGPIPADDEIPKPTIEQYPPPEDSQGLGNPG
jgi:hypothetical protein